MNFSTDPRSVVGGARHEVEAWRHFGRRWICCSALLTTIAVPAGALAETSTASVDHDKATAQAATPTSTDASPAANVVEPPLPAPADELERPGYLPGYRRQQGLGLAPYSPRVGSLPGGLTPSYGTPTAPGEWTFRFTGFMTASLQFSIDERLEPGAEQSSTVFHAPPSTIDEYASFVSTGTVPGHWVAMNFSYGNQYVSANVTFSTYNPTRPTSYYQLGSQNFLTNPFLTFTIPNVAGFRVNWTVGFFSNNYGALGRYGAGIYVNSLAGGPFGAGETLTVEYDLSDSWVGVIEHGLMGQRDGAVPQGVVPTEGNRFRNPLFPSDWVHHAHLGVVRKGEPRLRAQVHYLTNWSADDRTRQELDNPDTRAIDEANPRDGRIHVVGVDAVVDSQRWGYLAGGFSFIKGRDVYSLTTLTTYGGNGQSLTERWWGEPTGGTGTLVVGAVNYNFSLGRILSSPVPFAGDGPDINVNTGVHVATTNTELAAFDGRVRHKYGVDALYTFLPTMGAGLRLDRVVPNSKDPGETFHVLAARLQFKTNWTSRENLSLIYGKWFYGPRSRSEGTGLRSIDRLDDQLVALNFNMYW